MDNVTCSVLVKFEVISKVQGQTNCNVWMCAVTCTIMVMYACGCWLQTIRFIKMIAAQIKIFILYSVCIVGVYMER